MAREDVDKVLRLVLRLGRSCEMWSADRLGRGRVVLVGINVASLSDDDDGVWSDRVDKVGMIDTRFYRIR